MSVTALAREIESDVEQGDPERAIALYRCAAEHREDLPDARWHERVADHAVEVAQTLADSGLHERALRHLSLATILSREGPWLRRRTEHMRETVFPAPDRIVRRWL